MLLKNPISNTKRFFHRTLQTVKSIFSPTTVGNYHKIPKSPPPPSMNHIAVAAAAAAASSESGRVYVDFNNHRWEKSGKRLRDHDRRPNNSNAKCSTKEDVEEGNEWSREKKSWWVARKLKELEMMDTSDVDHVLDIEEVLHYYSRLSCPEYLDIVDKFFMDVYSEFFSSSSSSTPPTILHSTSKLHPARC
ncbi:hypothetical protein LINGRAHAP2_LOCUS21499 [Linum grandiflorum]